MAQYNFENLFTDTDYPADQPAPLQSLVKPKKAINEAFYTSALVNPEERDMLFNQVYDNLTQKGYDDAVELAKQTWAEDQDFQNQQIISNIIEDQTIPKEQKIGILQDYSRGMYISTDLKDQYAEVIASKDNSDFLYEQEAQDMVVNDLAPKLAEINRIVDENDRNDAIEDIGGELLKMADVVVTSVGGLVDLGVKTYDAIKQKIETGEVDWVENATASERLGDSWLKDITEWKLDGVAEFFGIKDDFDTSYTNRIFNTIGEKIVAIADFAVEKGVFKNREQALYTTEALGALWGGRVLYKNIKTRLEHSPGGGADVTTKANPKQAGEDLTEALVEPSNTKARKLNTSKEAIASENVLPKTRELPGEIIPTLDKRLDQITSLDELSQADRLVIEAFHDDNIGNLQIKFADRNRRVKLAEDANLNVNTASSQIDFPTTDTLSGKLVFTKSNDYPFTTKKEALDTAERIKKLSDKANAEELADLKKAGIKEDLQKITKSDIKIRDVDTKQEFTIDEFKKIKLDKRKFAVVYGFNKKYNFLADEMLGTPLSKSGISLLGEKAITEATNASSLGEFAFGTGFAAKWFEQAREAISPRAGRIKKEVHQEFQKSLYKNKKYKKEIGQVIELQFTNKQDLLTRTQLQKEFRGYSKEAIDAIDETQIAWRKAQDNIFEIMNEGERLALKGKGYSLAYFDDAGDFKGAIKNLSEKDIGKLDADTTVFDPVTQKHIKFTRNKSRTDGVYSKDGRKLVKLEERKRFDTRMDGNKVSDYILIKEKNIGDLPRRVVNKDKGHKHLEYKSKFFVETIPTELIINGKTITNKTPEGRELLQNYKEVKATSLTKTAAEKFYNELAENAEQGKYSVNMRNASLDNIKDFTDEYRRLDDLYHNARGRSTDMRHLQGEDVLIDPKIALENAVNRTVNTASYTVFDKAFEKAFIRDFAQVLPEKRFPTTINDISGKGNPKLATLEADAKNLWRRQTHFRTVSDRVKASDAIVQNGIHALADVFEKKIKLEKLPIKLRDLGDLGLTGINQKIMGYAGTLYITFSSPLRQFIIQPMMFYEQFIIDPKNFPKAFGRMPMHVLGLLHQDNKLLKGTYERYVNKLKPAEKADFLAEQAMMKKQGILESINLNLAMQEALKGRVGTLRTPDSMLGKVTEAVGEGFERVKKGFNQYGFTNAELMNRVGLWLQNKYRWIDDPRNKGKNWMDPRNAQSISFEAWKQSGAMTRAGQLGMQRVPVLSFLTQFQSIGAKSVMNILQDNATNLTRADRIKLVATRMVAHGLEFGAMFGAGKFLLDYFREHEDEQVRQMADELSRGVVDRMWYGLTETDMSISEQASVANINFYGDLYEEIINAGRWIVNDPAARGPNVPSVKAISRTFEKVNDVINMFTAQPVSAELLAKSALRLTEITSVGNKVMEGIQKYSIEQVLTKDGRRTGLTLTGEEAFWKGVMGLNTRPEIDRWYRKQLEREIKDRMAEAVDYYDQLIMSNLEDPTNWNEVSKYINLSFSLIEQAGAFNNSQMEQIKQQVLKKHKDRFTSNETRGLLNFIHKIDPNSADGRKLNSLLGNHTDPIVRQSAQYSDGLKFGNLFKEEE